MKTRTAAVLAVVVALLGAAPPAMAGSLSAWEMNESAGSSVMVDSGGSGINGTIGSGVKTGVTGSGATFYRFPFVKGLSKAYLPERLVKVGDTASLDPQGSSYTVTFRMRTKQGWVNVIQKGQSGAAGGFWKFELDDGYMQCLFRGPNGSFSRYSKARVNDGAWHTISCSRTASGVSMTVDGVATATRSGWTGPIDNKAPVSIGGKSSCNGTTTGCDYFSGDLDWVRISKG